MNRKDLTKGSISGNIITFALPYILAYFLQILYGLADLFIIGQYCDVDSTTAVSNGAQVMYLLTCTVIGLAMGAGLGKLITVVMDNPNITAVVTMNNVLMVFGVTTAIGIIFGWLPARQASRKNLIEILR